MTAKELFWFSTPKNIILLLNGMVLGSSLAHRDWFGATLGLGMVIILSLFLKDTKWGWRF